MKATKFAVRSPNFMIFLKSYHNCISSFISYCISTDLKAFSWTCSFVPNFESHSLKLRNWSCSLGSQLKWRNWVVSDSCYCCLTNSAIMATIAQLLGVVEKLSFFWVGHFEFFFPKKKFFFASFLFKLVTIYGIPRIFQNFDDYPDF